MNGVASLQSTSASAVLNLDKNAQPTNPDFYSVFAKINKGTEIQAVAFQYLKKKPAIELACLPFFEEACDEYLSLIANASEEVLAHGSDEDVETTCIALLRSCQDDTLPQSIKSVAKLLLLKCLEKMGFTDQSDLPCFARSCDPDHIIVHALKKLLLNTIEEVGLYTKAGARLRDRSPIGTGLCDSVIESGRKKNTPVYEYLQKNDNHIDDMLLDEAMEFFMTENPEAAMIIYEMLTDQNNAKTLDQAAQDLPQSKSDFLNYLTKTAHHSNRPKSMYWRGCEENNQQKSVEYFSKAALHGHQGAVKRLNNIAKNCDELEHIEPLSDIHHANANVGNQEWAKQINDLTTKAVREIQFWSKAWPIWYAHEALNISKNANFAQRIQIATKVLQENQDKSIFSGIEILDALSKLDHPLATKAKDILEAWLSEGTNRLWLIQQYADRCSDYVRECDQTKNYKCNLEGQLNRVFQQLHSLQSQQEVDKLQQLVYQLIDITIGWKLSEYDWTNKYLNELCSSIYQFLLSGDLVEGIATVEDIKIFQSFESRTSTYGKAAVENLHRFLPYNSVESTAVLACFTRAAKIPGTTIANYCLGTLLCPDRASATAASVQKALPYFQQAAQAGHNAARLRLIEIALDADNKFACAEQYMIKARRTFGVDQHMVSIALGFYEDAAAFGHEEAHFKLLTLSVERKNAPQAQFELGKLYLTGAHSPYPKQNATKAQKLLEDATKNGHPAAAFLVAQHYSPQTPHQPKFQCTDFMYKTPETKMLEFLERGIELSVKQKQDLKEILGQLDPGMKEAVFAVSQRYRNKHKNDQIADVLLDWAVEQGCDAAMGMKLTLLKKQMQETITKEIQQNPQTEKTFKRSDPVGDNAEKVYEEL